MLGDFKVYSNEASPLVDPVLPCTAVNVLDVSFWIGLYVEVQSCVDEPEVAVTLYPETVDVVSYVWGESNAVIVLSLLQDKVPSNLTDLP